eukprot:CAMPEP_0117697030 /NCGR_PEP_ID=MMETSP0804-20121206/29001_1 /TAXON_ID=1074897 /ORGANISM="Tetraselmis astigmatica, Strain CCMP880" /LENGTH=60 /DNA_ID=CAMNT_0005511233 /DNA_START=32 /DNA_END=211 /DNA_ORIENTATION=-
MPDCIGPHPGQTAPMPGYPLTPRRRSSCHAMQAEREDICQLMFEVFNVSGLFFCDQVFPR